MCAELFIFVDPSDSDIFALEECFLAQCQQPVLCCCFLVDKNDKTSKALGTACNLPLHLVL